MKSEEFQKRKIEILNIVFVQFEIAKNLKSQKIRFEISKKILS